MCQNFFEHTSNEIKRIFDVNVLAHFWVSELKYRDVSLTRKNKSCARARTVQKSSIETVRRDLDTPTDCFSIAIKFRRFQMLQAFLPDMIEKNYGHVVALSSMVGLCGFPNVVPYCSTKFAVRGNPAIVTSRFTPAQRYANDRKNLLARSKSREKKSRDSFPTVLSDRNIAGLMESLSEELRVSTKGKSLIKFTTIYPYLVDTGMCKKPKIRWDQIKEAQNTLRLAM